MARQLNDFTSANSFPYKILKQTELVKSINDEGRILPIHAQLCPTNACNLKCPFCSCAETDRKQKWSYSNTRNIISVLNNHKIKAATITGGGEPTLFKHINYLIRGLDKKSIQVGLVSNGVDIKRLKQSTIERLVWARISFSDYRDFNDEFVSQMDYLRSTHNVDLAFSYVVTDNLNESNVKSIMDYANNNNFTHVRFVNDIFNPNIKNVNRLQDIIQQADIDGSIAIYQDRSEHTCGHKQCRIGILKPMIGPDGYIYPCCGVQYALDNNYKGFPHQMRMSHYTNLSDIINLKLSFDGSVCTKCYYGAYNAILEDMIQEHQHQNFV